jgi:hypothetical protein
MSNRQIDRRAYLRVVSKLANMSRRWKPSARKT